MKDRIKTLLIYANGPVSRRSIVEDTYYQGLLRLQAGERLPAWAPGISATRVVPNRYETLSYMRDWQDAFYADQRLDVEACNILNLTEYVRARRKIREYPLVIVLHSAAGDNLALLRRTEHWFQRRRGKLLAFLGNEYDLMPDKIGFLRSVGADYVGSQLPLDAAKWLYAPAEHTRVLAAPHALNPQAYFPERDRDRPVDIGFIGTLYPYFIGDIERTRLIQFFQAHGTSLGLTCDIREQRMPRASWARFLNMCKGIIGAESGTYYLERNDETKMAVQAFVERHPGASFAEVFACFFRDYPNPVSGKAISSRHFEPIGTETCQILLEGRYNDILVPDEHYLAVKKDLSNLPEVIERFKDVTYRMRMARQTLDYALSAHTYRHRVDSLVSAIFSA